MTLHVQRKNSRWIRSLTYENSSPPPVNGFQLNTGVDPAPGLALTTPFGTCNAGSPAITGPGGQSANYYPVMGGAFISGNLGYGAFTITKSAGINHTLTNTSVSNALYNGSAFGIGATQSFTGSGSWTTDSTTGGGASPWVIMKTKTRGRRAQYRYVLGSSQAVLNWVNAHDAGRHYWRYVRGRFRST